MKVIKRKQLISGVVMIFLKSFMTRFDGFLNSKFIISITSAHRIFTTKYIKKAGL